VTVYQNKAEVEGAMVDQLQRYVLGEQTLAMVISQVRAEIAAQVVLGQAGLGKLRGDAAVAALVQLRAQPARLADVLDQLPQRHEDIAVLEAELAGVRAEQKRLARAIALSDDVPELVVELQQRIGRSHNLEAQLIAAKRTPAELAALIDRVEANVRTNVAKLRDALTDEAVHVRSGKSAATRTSPSSLKQIWFRLRRDPNGERCKRNLAFVCPWISWRYPRSSYRNLERRLGNI
jgi:hypothetical protein